MNRLSTALRAAGTRLRRHGGSVLIAAVAAGLAYAVAAAVFGAENAFFAPIAAVIAVGLSGGQRIQRTVEITGGVLMGVVVGEVISLLPLPTAVTLGLAVALGMAAAVAVRATSLLTNQTAVAAVVTTVLVPLTPAPPFVRLADAVLGGAVALLIAVPATLRPERHLGRTLSTAINDMADIVVEVSNGLRDPAKDLDATVRHTIQATGYAASLDEAVRAARESVQFGRRGHTLARLRHRATSVRDEWLHFAASLTSLARAARAIRRSGETQTNAPARVAELAEVIRHVARWAAGPGDPSDVGAIRGHLEALGRSLTRDLAENTPSGERVLYISVRSAIVDLLRMTGMPHAAAIAAVTGN